MSNGFRCRFCSCSLEQANVLEISGGRRTLRTYICDECMQKVQTGVIYHCRSCGNIWLVQQKASDILINVDVCEVCVRR
jgi:hypothetical protein